MNDNADNDPRLYAIPDIHGHAKGEHKAFTDERPIPLSARMLFLWFYHACRRGWPRFLMVTDHMNYLTFEDPAAINLVRRALKLAQAGDLYGAAETASVEVGHAAVVSEGLRRGMHYSIGAEVDNDPRSRPDAQNIVDAMKPDGMIRSVHFLTIDHPTHGAGWNWPFDNPEFADVYNTVGTQKTWELYMTTLLDAIERLPGNIVGHFYVPALFGHWPEDAVLDEYENQLVDACDTRGMAIELNTRFLYRDHSDEEKAKYLAAYRRLLRKCKAKNVGVAVGSDAHSPKDQGRSFAAILALLDECEINELVFPIAGRLARVALRVERKPDPVPVAEPVPESLDGERKGPRKARTTEAPTRSKDSSSKRDDSAGTTGDGASNDEPPAAKSKSRPKRSKRAASTSEVSDDTSTNPSESGENAQLEDAQADGAVIDQLPTGPLDGELPATELSSVPTDAPIAHAAGTVDDAAIIGDTPATSDTPPVEQITRGDKPLVTATPNLTDVPAGADVADDLEPENAVEPEPALSTPPVRTTTKAKLPATTVKTKAPAAKTKASAKKAAKSPAKSGVKKSAAKKSTGLAKAGAKKTSAKKSVAKKTAGKKVEPRNGAGKKSTVKKAAPKKATAKKAGAKKTATKRR